MLLWNASEKTNEKHYLRSQTRKSVKYQEKLSKNRSGINSDFENAENSLKGSNPYSVETANQG